MVLHMTATAQKLAVQPKREKFINVLLLLNLD